MEPTDTPGPGPDTVEQLLTSGVLQQSLREAGIDVDDDQRLVPAAAIGAAHALWRNTILEDWHATDWGLSDGEMMRANAATVRLIRSRLDTGGTDWAALAAEVTAGRRRLPDGRTLHGYAGKRLPALRRHAAATAALYADVQDRHGPRAALLLPAVHSLFYGTAWHGSPAWPAVVATFTAALADPGHPHWRGGFVHADLPPLPDQLDTDTLAAALLAGPDTLSADAAAWCVRAGLGYVRPATTT